MTPPKALILGTRGSKLALAQSESCAGRLRARGLDVEVRAVRTTSDHHPETPISVIDRRDVFTRQLDEALLAGEIDLAVHSLKDVPTDLPDGIVLAAVTERHDPSDVLVSEGGWDLDGLPDGATVATGSLRRKAQLLRRRPDLRVVEIRGNVETRVRKMRGGAADAVVLARAGLERLKLEGEIPHKTLARDVMLPAVGQGFLAATTLNDHPMRAAIRDALNDEAGERAARAEREMLRTLEGGCRVPVGALADVRGGEVRLQGLVASPDGALVYEGESRGREAEDVGRRLARELLDRGAGIVLGEVREVRS